MRSVLRLAPVLVLMFASIVSAAQPSTPPPLDAFFAGLRVRQVSISPDGRLLALNIVQDGNFGVFVQERSAPQSIKQVAAFKGEDGFLPQWCRWANNQRLLCSLRGLVQEMGLFLPITRLVSVNADGTDLKVLGKNYRAVSGDMYQDRIVDWTPDKPDTVLIAIDEGSNGEGGRTSNGGYSDGYPDIYELNINTGERKLVQQENPPIQTFISDGKGNLRLGVGTRKDDTVYMVRRQGETEWRELTRIKAFQKTNKLSPVAIIPDSNFAYATGNSEGREALWKVDLTDAAPPTLVYSHDQVDLGAPLLDNGNRLVGVTFETDKPQTLFFDKELGTIYQALLQGLGGRTLTIDDYTPNFSTLVIHTNSDTEAPVFYTLDRDGSNGGKLMRIGSSAPGLASYALAEQKPITYTSRDGKTVPGYLTLPVQVAGSGKPPLIVMPHGGPYARDSWGFDPWLQYLASQGYAVLQMQFRASTGYGYDWFESGFRDWGGLPYNDVIDGTKWALAEGYADPARVCVVGASYGGYVALLIATRNADKIFRCSIAISGVSDLTDLKRETAFIQGEVVSKSIGIDDKKLREDSPRAHVAQVNVPLMLIHGDRDYTVQVSQTKAMDSALKSAGKPHETVIIKGTDHYFLIDAHRRLWFTSMGDFLKKNLSP
jgi:dipeptidyl aminopeptidase/acylaminoacyl peptidase